MFNVYRFDLFKDHIFLKETICAKFIFCVHTFVTYTFPIYLQNGMYSGWQSRATQRFSQRAVQMGPRMYVHRSTYS